MLSFLYEGKKKTIWFKFTTFHCNILTKFAITFCNLLTKFVKNFCSYLTKFALFFHNWLMEFVNFSCSDFIPQLCDKICHLYIVIAQWNSLFYSVDWRTFPKSTTSEDNNLYITIHIVNKKWDENQNHEILRRKYKKEICFR